MISNRNIPENDTEIKLSDSLKPKAKRSEQDLIMLIIITFVFWLGIIIGSRLSKTPVEQTMHYKFKVEQIKNSLEPTD